MTEFPCRLLRRDAAPSIEPITLSEMKTFLRVDDSASDALITQQIQAARFFAEEMLRKSLITQRWKLAFDGEPPALLELPYPPVQSVVSVTSFTEAEVASVVNAATYHLDAAKETLVFEAVPYGHRVEVIIECGYGALAMDVPAAIRYRADVTAAMRVLFEGRSFNILSVVNVEEAKVLTEMLAEEGGAV